MGRRTVLVDLDGVLAAYDRWRGVEHIGAPIPGAVEFTRQLAEFSCVVIYTTRCKEYPPGTPKLEDGHEPDRSCLGRLVDLVRDWLDLHGFTYHDLYVGQGKPPASAIVDDRAVPCRPQGADSPGAYAAALTRCRALVEDEHDPCSNDINS